MPLARVVTALRSHTPTYGRRILRCLSCDCAATRAAGHGDDPRAGRRRLESCQRAEIAESRASTCSMMPQSRGPSAAAGALCRRAELALRSKSWVLVPIRFALTEANQANAAR